jgi:lipopolysaccharide export system permease protein
MAAMTACGIGPLQVYRPLLMLGLVLSLGVGVLSLQLAPWAQREVQAIKEVARQEADVGDLGAGQFRSAGGVVFYAEGVTSDGKLSNVFLERRDGDRVEVVVARSAEQKSDAARNLRVMVLYEGRRYEGVPGEPAFRIMDFAEHGIPIALDTGGDGEIDIQARPVSALLAAGGLAERAELQWRLAAPISSLMLVLLALPLARTDPRQGRYGKLALGILVYIVYANLLGAGQVWLGDGVVPAFLGLWWVHGLIALLAGVLLWRLYGRRKVKTRA